MKTLRITVNGTPYDVQVEEVSGGAAPAVPAAAPAPKAAPAPQRPRRRLAQRSFLLRCRASIMSIDVEVGQASRRAMSWWFWKP